MKKLFFLPLVALLLFSCSDDDYGSSDDDGTTPVETVNAVQVRNDATFGSVLTDAEGFSLYFFAVDSKGASNCNGGCAESWPPFYTAELSLDSALSLSDFGSIDRDDGSKQTTFKGWPLYRFASDDAPSTIAGDGAGGTWFVAKPDYTIMVSKAQLIGRDANGNETNLTSDYLPGDEATTFMTNANGITMYRFSNDQANTNTFTAPDLSNNGVWPMVERNLQQVPSIFDRSDFGTITVFGREQLTYKGWPLYYFGQDTDRGENYGVGFPAAGVWPILNTETAQAPPADETIAATYTITNQGATAYIFNGEAFDDTVNPDLTLERGKTYEFVIDTPGHPFLINSVQATGTDNMYMNGVTNNGAAQGTIRFSVPETAPDELYYNCEFHGSMTGIISIID